MRKLFLFVLLLMWPTLVFAQAPCGPTPTTLTLVTANSEVVAEFADYNATLGTGNPIWTDVDVSIFAKGANPSQAVPTASVAVAKAAWTLAAGQCYRTKPTILFGVPVNTELDLYIRTKRGSGADLVASTWVGPVPFGRLGPPAVPTALRLFQPAP